MEVLYWENCSVAVLVSGLGLVLDSKAILPGLVSVLDQTDWIFDQAQPRVSRHSNNNVIIG